MEKLDVLVIEDDPMVRKMICWQLSQNPELNIESFSNGEECYRNYKRQPDILVSDYYLSETNDAAMNGVKFSRLFPKAYKVLVTGSRGDSIAQEAVDGGFQAMIHKGQAWQNELTTVVSNIMKDIKNPLKVKDNGEVSLMKSKVIFGSLMMALAFLVTRLLFVIF